MAVDLAEGRFTKDSVLPAIPAFPPIIFRVLDLLSSDRPDVVPLVEAISSDAALSAQLLQMANSPRFGLPAQVDSVHRAALKLGFIHIQSLVMAIATTNYKRSAPPTEALDRCWRHTLATAAVCRELGRASSMPADRMYSFGLLHDLGRLGLLAAFPAEYDELLQIADRDALPLLDLERRRFGMDHCEIGRLLFEHWKLPLELGVIAAHHDSVGGASLDFLRMIRLGCQFAATLGYALAARPHPLSFEDLLGQLPLNAREQFPTDPAALRGIIEETREQDRAFADVPLHRPGPVLTIPPSRRPVPALPPVPDCPASAPPARPRRGFAAWDSGVVLLVAMVMLVLVAGALCLRNV